MKGNYDFECMNPACDWGVRVQAASESEATSKAFALHDEHWKSMTKNDVGGTRICPGEHYTIRCPDGTFKEF